MVAALLPNNTVSGHKVPTIEFEHGSLNDTLLWLGVANSLVMDFLVRKKVSLTMSYTIMDSLPFPRDFANTPSADAIARRVCALCAVGEEMEGFRAQAVKAGILEAPDAVIEAPDQRAVVAAEIDVLVARDVFGQSKREMLYILDPDNILGADCGVETFKALRNAELREFKEFRTQRLIEEAWDRVEADVASAMVNLPALDILHSDAWAWPASVQPRDRLRYAAQYALWLMDSSINDDQTRFLIASLAEPALLTPLLTGPDRDQWIRLVGAEARFAQGVVRLRPAINQAWTSMFDTLITSGQLVEGSDGRWARGPHFSAAGLDANSIHAQRTAFAMAAVRGMEIGKLTAAVAQDDNVIWMRFGHG